jgi:hypothetical protein
MPDTFTDPQRERDLADLGINAIVKVAAGGRSTATVELDLADLDVLIAGPANKGYDPGDLDDARTEAYDDGHEKGWDEAIDAMREYAQDIRRRKGTA